MRVIPRADAAQALQNHTQRAALTGDADPRRAVKANKTLAKALQIA
jgi:hypothetical protein